MSESPFEQILVPTDLTEFSDAAVAHAGLFQRKLRSKITLLHAAEFSLDLEGHLEELAARYRRNGLAIETRLVDDQPATAILATAEEIEADLIVMPTHARGALPRAVLGSVTERVLRATTRPLMTIVPDAVPSPQLRTVLCPVNFTEVARHSLEHAMALADAFDATLVVMHVVEGELPLFSHVGEAFESWVDPLVRDRTRYEQVIIHGDPAVRIAETAETIGASVIVIGAQRRSFGSPAKIIRAATRPVITVVPRPPAALLSQRHRRRKSGAGPKARAVAKSEPVARSSSR